MSTSAPLVVVDMTTVGDGPGTVVKVQCREPQPCIVADLRGPSANVHWAAQQLERLHQAQHAVRVEEGQTP